MKLHGLSHNYVWTKLASNAVPGSNVIELDVEVDWAPGSEIIITPTSYNFRELEKCTIRSVTNNGRTLLLDQALEHLHLGQSESLPTGHTYANKAEVGLLTRNIKIQGEGASETFGGRVLVGVRSISDGDGFYTTHRGVCFN